MKFDPELDYSELVQIILESIQAFPKEFLESFCLPHDVFRDKGYNPSAETISLVRTIFADFLKKFDLPEGEMKLITAHDAGCCSNPTRQLVSRWFQKKTGVADNPDIWKIDDVVILSFENPLLNQKIAELIFEQSDGHAKVRLYDQFDHRTFYPIKGGLNDRKNLNSAIPYVYVEQHNESVRLDLNSVLHQNQVFEYLDREDLIIGKIEDRFGINYPGAMTIGHYFWEKDDCDIYRAKAYFLLVKEKGRGNSRVKIISTNIEEMEIPWT